MIKKISTILFIATCFAVLLLSNSVKAAGEQSDPSVSPAIINLSLEAGESKQSSYTFFNDSDEDITISVDVRAFRPSNGEHGTPIFQDENGKKYVSEITDWVKLKKNSYDVAANSNVVVDFEVDVPESARTGKYFAAIFNAESAAEAMNGSLVKKEIGVTLVTNVTNVLPLEQKPEAKSFLSKIPWTTYAGAGFAAAVVILLLIMELKNKKKPWFSWGKRRGGKRG